MRACRINCVGFQQTPKPLQLHWAPQKFMNFRSLVNRQRRVWILTEAGRPRRLFPVVSLWFVPESWSEAGGNRGGKSASPDLQSVTG